MAIFEKQTVELGKDQIQCFVLWPRWLLLRRDTSCLGKDGALSMLARSQGNLTSIVRMSDFSRENFRTIS